MARKEIEEAAARLAEIQTQLEAVAPLYRELGQLEKTLIPAVLDCRDNELRISAGRAVVIRDQFLDRDGDPTNEQWMHSCAKRFKLAVVPAGKRAGQTG